MTRVLCVAEKPSVAKQISEALGQSFTVERTRNKFCKRKLGHDRNLGPWTST